MKKLSIGCTLVLILSFSISANELTTSLLKCKQVENALERLTCFDKAAQGLSSTDASKTPKSQTNNALLKANPKPDTTQENISNFGNEHKADAKKLPERMYANIHSIAKGPYKNLIFTLDNGQIWKQIDSGRFKAQKGDKIFIKRGALNSFFIGKDGINKNLRVKRIK